MEILYNSPQDESADEESIQKEITEEETTRKRQRITNNKDIHKAKKRAEIKAADDMAASIINFHEFQKKCDNCQKLQAKIKEKEERIQFISREITTKGVTISYNIRKYLRCEPYIIF